MGSGMKKCQHFKKCLQFFILALSPNKSFKGRRRTGAPLIPTLCEEIQMSLSPWIPIAIAIATIANSWIQFFVKEVLLAKTQEKSLYYSNFILSKKYILFIAASGVLSAASIGFLYLEVSSPEPLSRISCFLISLWSVISVLNVFLIQSIFTIRRIARLKIEIIEAEKRANEKSIVNALIFG
jgi:hypothetical protein